MKKSYGMVFPGQGSQSVGMLGDIANQFPSLLETFAMASDLLGYDLWSLVQKGPEEKLDETFYTQPAMLVADVALYRCFLEQGGNIPSVMAGHSLGEYAALVCGGYLKFEDAVTLVQKRAQFMQEAVKPGEGAMAAIIGLEPDKINSICYEAAGPHVVDPANFNSVGQTVIAGHRVAVERAVELAKKAGSKLAKLIPVSVPAHCGLMKPAMQKFEKLLADIEWSEGNVPVIFNVDAEIHNSPSELISLLAHQLVSPVRWVSIIRAMGQMGVTDILECGAGKVLAGLNKRILPDLTTYSMETPTGFEQALAISKHP